MRRHLGTLSAAALILVLGSALASPAGADPDGPDPTVPAAADPGAKASAAGAGNRSEQAKAALTTVQAMFAGGGNARSRASGQAPDATMALRDLSRLMGSLSADDQKRATAFLARPTDGTPGPFGDPGYTTTEATPVCGVHVCVHYVTTTTDAVSATDVSPADEIPDYVALVLSTLEFVHNKYVGAGYRPPLSDDNSVNDGGSALTDIYLSNVGESSSLYGYCSSDDTEFNPPVTGVYDASAYCVLDNDYSSAEFGTSSTPTQNLQVTAAHEYFHAVQFAYDYWEDSWLLEATATWVEDEVYDSVNDNRQFLSDSPLTHPWVPLDYANGSHEYGDWIFFRHLTERFGTAVGGLPTFVRDIFTRVDGSAVGSDQYSIQAVRNTLVARGTTFPAAFSRFAALNRRAKTTYNEGATYPNAPLVGGGSLGLTATRRTTNWLYVKISHMASATARVKPGTSLKASDWRLRINVDLPKKTRGSAATVQVYKRNGSVAVYPITLTSSGDATKTFPFAVGSVRYVELTLANGSTRFNCWQEPGWSCFGTPLDDNLRFEFRATAFRA